MSYDIVTIGAMLCEVMRKELDKPLHKPADFTGPYPSGDTPIFLNAAAKLGSKCAMIGATGNDGFGRCLTERLEESGIDIRMVKVVPGATTGTAFVCYYSDGRRNFIYHARHAAAGMIFPEDIDMKQLQGTKWIHITGYTLSINSNCSDSVYKIIEELPEGTKISFDPNIRPESLSVEEIIKLCAPVIRKASIIFPSKTEAAMFTGTETDEEGCKKWAEEGKIVVLKNGEAGSIVFTKEEVMEVPSYTVKEVDPTGAGDTFCGAFLTAMIEGKPLKECARFANAAAAMSVCKQGPMEGTPSREELEKFIKLND